MTASNPSFHETELDECCTNVYALTDLCGLRWRKYAGTVSQHSAPLDDPVLRSFSTAIAHDFLCAWRGTASTASDSKDTTEVLPASKELWVFWFHEDPNLQGIIAGELKESGHGYWEDGFPHEPRSMFFKALHNLFERCLLANKFVRLGKWFQKPIEKPDDLQDSNSPLSLSFSFFVLGESTVCTSVEIQQQPKVYRIQLEDVALAASKAEGLPVLLCPYGLRGTLTGHSSNEDNINANDMLEKWRKFYPTELGMDWTFSANQAEEQDAPLLVQVLFGEVQMWYPSVHVMRQCQELGSIVSSLCHKDAPAPGTDAPCTSLTPPASPSDPTKTDVAIKRPVGGRPVSRAASTSRLDKKKLTRSLVLEMWHETTANKSVPRNPSKPLGNFLKPEPSQGNDLASLAQWDFEEPFKRTNCSCTSSSNISRPKPPTQMRSFSFARSDPATSNLNQSPQQQQQQVQTTAKLKKEKKKALVPFHHRTKALNKEALGIVKSRVGTVTKGLPTVNVLTSVNQKRHSEVARTSTNSTKYSLRSQEASHAANEAIVKQEYVTVNSKEDFLLTDLDFPLKKVTVEPCTENQGSVASSAGSDAKWKDSHVTKTGQRTKHEYVLPVEGSFHLPVLLGDSLDCRRFNGLPSPSAFGPLSNAPNFVDRGAKRPPAEVDLNPAPSPSKRLRCESSAVSGAGAARLRSDSSSSCGRLKGRRSSSVLSPAATSTPLSDPFTPQSDEVDTELIQPPLKSPTQKGRPRRRSSVTNAASSPAAAEPKPATVKSRRQSLRKQQYEESGSKKDKQQARQRGSRAPSSDQVEAPALPGSPPTPSALPSLMTAKGLMVTASDLDRLFDTDEEEDDDDVKGGRSFLGNGLGAQNNGGMSDVLISNTQQSVVSTGTVASTDLARMFPTPPSLEPAAHSPPYLSSEYVNPESVKALLHHGTSPEAHPLLPLSGSDAELEKLTSPKELGPVFEIPETRAFPVSYSFEAIKGLPSSRSPLPSLPEDCTYQPTWQFLSKQEDLLMRTGEESAIPVNDLPCAAERSPTVGYNFLGPPSASSDVRHLASVALSPTSPGSSLSSFSVPSNLSKPVGAVASYRPKLLSSPLPEGDALVRVLSLSDSRQNYFSDCNYDHVNLCTCSSRAVVKSQPRRKTGQTVMNFSNCSCGFGALEAAKFTEGAGLFPEDEVGRVKPMPRDCRRTSSVSSTSLAKLEVPSPASCFKFSKSLPVSASLMEIILDQCSSPLSCSTFCRQVLNSRGSNSSSGSPRAKQDQIPVVPPASSVASLHELRSLLQTALQRSTSRKTWEQPNGTAVQGPLSWKQLHHLATKGLEATPKAQPVPSVVVGNAGDWLTLSPLALVFWDKLLLEPYSSQRDVAYIVVSPDNEAVLNSAKLFFKELSSAYETCLLGRHVPVVKILRDGILRIGPKQMLKASKEPVDDWFGRKANTPEGARLKLYAQVCKHMLGPQLWSLASERHLLDQDKSDAKFGEGDRPPVVPLGDNGQRTNSASSEGLSSAFSAEEERAQSSQDVPTVVVYLLDPFGSGTTSGAAPAFSSHLGLLRCVSEVVPLPAPMKINVVFQIVPMEQVLQVDTLARSREASSSFVTQLKCLAFSVFSRCRKTVVLCPSGRSLTGFGPAARHEAMVKQRETGTETLKLYSSPYVLSSPLFEGASQSEAECVEKLAPVCRMPTVLFCGYCLSRDQRWLLAVCTDSAGEMVETCAVAVDKVVKPDGKLRKTSARRRALGRLWEFCLGVMSGTLTSWQLVISKLGRMGPGELKDWKETLRNTSMDSCRHDFSETCTACRAVTGPTVQGVSVLSLEPEPAVRMFLAKGVLARLLDSQMSVAAVAKPEVASTYIAVFPTASLTKPSSRAGDSKAVTTPDTTVEQPVTDTDILLAGADDDENDEDPLRTLIPLMTSPPALSPGILGSSPVASPLAASPIRPSPPQGRAVAHAPSPGLSVQSPFQPISRASPFQPMQSTPSPSVGTVPNLETGPDEGGGVVCEPVAQGFYISTMQTGKMPSSFWANNPNTEGTNPVILKACLYVKSDPAEAGCRLGGPSREASPGNPHCEALRHILQRFDALSWLTVDPVSRDRRSCLPVHLYMLCHLHDTFSVLLDGDST